MAVSSIGKIGSRVAENSFDPILSKVSFCGRAAQRLDRTASRMEHFYPYHAARADLLRRIHQREDAADAYRRALALCGNPAEPPICSAAWLRMAGEW
jgi:predicted RNA polymerase sigma factor